MMSALIFIHKSGQGRFSLSWTKREVLVGEHHFLLILYFVIVRQIMNDVSSLEERLLQINFRVDGFLKPPKY